MTIQGAEFSDADIINSVLDGNVNAFETIVHRYRGLVLSIVARHVPPGQIEELAHEAFIRAFQSLKKIKDVEKFKNWLSTVTIRTCYDYLRIRYRSREIRISELSERQQNWLEKTISDHSEETWAKKGRQKEASDLLDWLLGKLNAAERMVLELVYLDGYSVKHTSELLGWSRANVKVRAFRARKKLQKLIVEKGWRYEN